MEKELIVGPTTQKGSSVYSNFRNVYGSGKDRITRVYCTHLMLHFAWAFSLNTQKDSPVHSSSRYVYDSGKGRITRGYIQRGYILHGAFSYNTQKSSPVRSSCCYVYDLGFGKEPGYKGLLYAHHVTFILHTTKFAR